MILLRHSMFCINPTCSEGSQIAPPYFDFRNSQPFKFYEIFVIQFFQISILNFADFMENDKIKKYISSLIFSADSWNSLKIGMVSHLIII